ncbi:ABC transporter B family member 9-like [Olea europaea subsp. europaea]|uniref:ABC transporter B family member 9-like n=1 Tax=Olea europaea subsp. europaea TaxID=158383 RepID=A0A8S0V7X7_OLEEU|nr:ABC transporter B family member 9-like [Olea europaea subsp. europaea]
MVIFFILGILGFTALACTIRLGARISYMRTLLRQDIEFFDTQTTMDVAIGRMFGDTILIQEAIGEKVGKFIQFMSTFIGGFIIAFCKGWLLSLVSRACIPALVIAGGSMSLPMMKMWSQGQVAYVEAGYVVEQTIGAIRMVASFIGENKAAEKYDSKLQIAYASTVQQGLASCIARPEVQIFSGLLLHVVSVQTAALVGQSETEKSTVFSFLERFYDPDAGEVLIDGFTLKMLKLKWIGGKMGLVSQEPILFATTLKENILFGKEMILMKRLEQQ